MRRDRDGSPIEDEEQPPLITRHYCRNGWKGETPDGRPIPCLECKPHLTRYRTAY